MKKLTLLITLSLTFSALSGQTMQHNTLNNDSLIVRLRADIKTMQDNLAKYHKTREVAYYLAFGTVALGGMGYVFTRTTNYELRNVALFASGLSSIASLITFWNAEKWLKNASVSISPGSIKVTF